jgi:hypothetical protein
LPLAHKVFLFFGKTYQCTMSKINEEFWNLYRAEMLPCPKEENNTDTSWLKTLSNSTMMVDGSANLAGKMNNVYFNLFQYVTIIYYCFSGGRKSETGKLKP